jgi:RNA polymerase sigma-70 factor (ECF subfamily)
VVEAAAVRRLALRGHDPSRVRSLVETGLSPRRRFEELLDRHEAMLRRVAFGMLGEPDRVDDVVQEALLKAFRKLPPSFESERQEAVWLYRIVHRCCLDELRRRRRRPEEALGSELAAAGADADSSLAVGAALAALPPDRRAVVLLVDLIGFDYESAAAVLGIPRGTVASRLNAARARLREALDA